MDRKRPLTAKTMQEDEEVKNVNENTFVMGYSSLDQS